VALQGKDRGSLVMAGLRAGDVLRRVAGTPSSVLPSPRRVSAAETLALAPGLRSSDLRGGLLSFDGQLIDDARLVVALARTAAGFGAKILTRARVTELAGDGARVRDELTGESFDVKARKVVNAAGVWAGQLVPSVRLRPSRGSHLVLSAESVGLSSTALTVPIPGENNRFVLLLPQPDGRVYLGLTDEPADGPLPDVPEVPQSDVDFLLGVASSVLQRPLTSADVIGAYAGLRPLIEQEGAANSADLSRKHAVLTSPDGVITVVGGKLTTYRRMAADAIDAIALSTEPSSTRNIPLVGATRSTVDASRRLVAKYGSEAPKVLALNMPDVIVGEVTAAEVVWAYRHEGALDADDVLDRRTRIGLVAADRELAAKRLTD
jgi:glycerol-3-phosphate dehydrogenase